MKNGMDHVTILQSSCLTLEGVDAVKNAACSLFETNHLENQMISNRTAMLKPTISLTKVKPPASRPPHIPESILKERQRLKDDTNSSNTLQKVEEESFRTLRQIEEENGGAGVFSIDLNSEWNLKNEEWKYDIMPEIFQGKNIADFIDPEIEEKLKKLEEEEDKLLEESNMMEVVSEIGERKKTCLTCGVFLS
jgi:nucleolar GTP-binding protein